MSDASDGRGVKPRPETTASDVAEDPLAPAADDGGGRTGELSVTTEPGARRTSNVELLVIEAELVADGHEPDNPAQPIDESVAAAFSDRIDDTALEPAWLRPWEGDE